MADEYISEHAALSSRVGAAETQTTWVPKAAGLVAVFAVLVQQGAFISSPVLFFGSAGGSADAGNFVNTIAIFLNIILVAPFCILDSRSFFEIVRDNKAAAGLVLLIFASVIWSLHPDVTIRRDINYLSTVLTACFLAARFDVDEIVESFSWGIGIAAIFSFVFVVVFPIDAIHQAGSWQLSEGENIVGAWKGVYSHKNVLGHTMALGVMAELYIFTAGRRRRLWHGFLLVACFALVILSRSSTALILSFYYFLGAFLLVISQNAKQYLSVALTALFVLGLSVLVVYWADPDFIWNMLGRDPTLTGRTVLWTLVINVISEHLLLGWGYGAMWLPKDPLTLSISEAVGWQVPQAHNAFLEVALELGLVGWMLVMIFIAISLWRATRLLIAGKSRIGMTTLIFFVGALITGMTESNLAQNQAIEWVILSALSFRCGLDIRSLRNMRRFQ